MLFGFDVMFLSICKNKSTEVVVNGICIAWSSGRGEHDGGHVSRLGGRRRIHKDEVRSDIEGDIYCVNL